MKLYSLETKQNFPISPEVAWDFLSDPNNLKEITPDYMGFNIISSCQKEMYAGQIIEYIVKPLFGIPIKWVTEITHVEKNKFFVDEQRFGPYALWHHKHFIREIDGGIEMEDVIHYKIPFGPLGVLANYLFVQKKLGSIFVYRRKKLIELFGDLK